MNNSLETTLQILSEDLTRSFGNKITETSITHRQLMIEVSPQDLFVVAQELKTEFKFEQLLDLFGVDYLSYGEANWDTKTISSTGFGRGVFDFETEETCDGEQMERRFAVVYNLLSMTNNYRLCVKVFPDDVQMPRLPSLIEVWNCANWYEREAFDMFGIIFDNHPDLRRLLTDYGFVGHPLRKDFPLEGKLEVRYSIEEKKVIYQPVSIENRINNPKVIRED